MEMRASGTADDERPIGRKRDASRPDPRGDQTMLVSRGKEEETTIVG